MLNLPSGSASSRSLKSLYTEANLRFMYPNKLNTPPGVDESTRVTTTLREYSFRIIPIFYSPVILIVTTVTSVAVKGNPEHLWNVPKHKVAATRTSCKKVV